MTSDADLCARLVAGDRSAVRDLLNRDYPVAVFFASAITGGPDAVRVVAAACENLLAEIVMGGLSGGLRRTLLAQVAAALVDASSEERPGTRGPLGSFAAAGDRWEGWWQDEPPAWPPGLLPYPEQVLHALRRLPAKHRAVLVLRDVGQLSAFEAAAIIGGAGNLDTLLESAREGYLVELDREVAGS